MALSLPPDHGPARDEAILAYIQAKEYTAELSPVTSSYNGHSATFWVFQDALKIEGVRVNVSARLQQTIADMLGCSLMTAKIADLAWMQRGCTITPCTKQITSATSAMIDNSGRIDAAISRLAAPPVGIIQTVGKHWLIDNDLAIKSGKAENYGWHFEGSNFQGLTGEVNASLQKDSKGQYVRLIQGRGWAHDIDHVDYSQICVLMAQSVVVDGAEMELAAVLTNPELAPLGSHQGKMSVLRQPGVPQAQLVEMLLPPINIVVESDSYQVLPWRKNSFGFWKRFGQSVLKPRSSSFRDLRLMSG
jgi:hypothetical protein